MSYKVKGSAGPFIQDIRFSYDPEDSTYYKETTYGGSALAIQGQSAQFRAKNKGHVSIIEPNGTGQTTERTPLAVLPENLQLTERYEIATEFIEQDIFRHKAVSDAADTYDAGIASGADTFRKLAEDHVETGPPEIVSVLGRVTQHLRKGVTGFEREYIILRRSRKLPYTGIAPVIPASILDGRFIYTTEQLLLPTSIAFSLPPLSSLPQSDWDDVQWGWRRRPSSVVFDGDFIEQSSEFVLAEWSLLLYEIATGAAGW